MPIALMQTQREIIFADFMDDTDPDEVYRAGKVLAWDEHWDMGNLSGELKAEVGQAHGLPDYDPGSPVLYAQYEKEMEVVHDVVLPFAVDVPEAACWRTTSPQRAAPCAARWRLPSHAADDMVEMWLYPETEKSYDLWFGGSVDFVDADGRQGQFKGHSRGISALMRQDTLPDGWKRIFYAASRSGLAEMPEEIILCPFVRAEKMNEEGIYPVEYLMEYAVRLKLNEESLKIVQ